MRFARGQITGFVLIGLALLLVLFLLLAVRNSLRGDSLPDGFEYKVVKGYVEGCVDVVVAERLRLLGAQGGHLLSFQGGLTRNDDPFLLNETAPPRYLGVGLASATEYPFRPPRGAIEFTGRGIASADQEPYPWPDAPFTVLHHRLSDWSSCDLCDGPYGQLALPPVCERNGSNTVNGPMRCDPSLFPTGRPNSSAPHPSIQASLAAAISRGVSTCLDAPALATLLGEDVLLTVNGAAVTFTPEDILVMVNLSLRTGGERRSAMDSFEKRYPVRVYSLFRYLHRLVLTMTKEHPAASSSESCNLSRLVAAVPGYDGFVVTFIEMTGGRLWTVTDQKSRIEMNPWSVQFFVADRRPVLDNISAAATGSLTVQAWDPDCHDLVVNAMNSTGTVTLSSGPITLRGPYNFSVVSTKNASLSDWQHVTFSNSISVNVSLPTAYSSSSS